MTKNKYNYSTVWLINLLVPLISRIIKIINISKDPYAKGILFVK